MPSWGADKLVNQICLQASSVAAPFNSVHRIPQNLTHCASVARHTLHHRRRTEHHYTERRAARTHSAVASPFSSPSTDCHWLLAASPSARHCCHTPFSSGPLLLWHHESPVLLPSSWMRGTERRWTLVDKTVFPPDFSRHLTGTWRKSVITAVDSHGSNSICLLYFTVHSLLLFLLFHPRRDDIIGGWCKLHNFCSSPNIIRMITSKTMRWVRNLARMGEKKEECIQVSGGKVRRKHDF
jgi:hypothetical protein